MKKKVSFFILIIFTLSYSFSFAAKAFTANDSTQTKQYLLQLYNHKLQKIDYKISKEQFIDRYAYNKKTEDLINYYFSNREKKSLKNMSWSNFFLNNFIYSFFNFTWYFGVYQTFYVAFLALLVASAAAIAVSILFLIFISVLLINLFKLFYFSRRKLLVELIETAKNES